MISNEKNVGKAKIAKETASSWSPKNLYAVDNVNVAQGPRVGVNGAPGKRASFQQAKEAREPLATIIQDAYERRAHEYAEHEYTNGGSIHDNTYERTKPHGVKLGNKHRK